MIKIAIVDDHSLFREGLYLLFNKSKNIQVSVIAENGKDLLDKLRHTRADIVLLDLKMPVMDGYVTCLKLNENYPDIKIIILTSFLYPYTIKRMFELNIKGYFSKNVDIAELKKGILKVNEGEAYYEKKLSAEIERIINLDIKDIYPVKFSDKELQIIRLTLKQMSNQEIADQLTISPKTVESHKYNMMQKINAKNFLGVIKYAFKHDYLYIKEMKY